MTDSKSLYPLLFRHNPFTLVWGSEDWIVSAVPGKESVVENGSLAGSSLSQLAGEHGEALLGKKVVDIYGLQFPLLIKFIDAHDDLSIQVHPNDAIAKERHNSMGKTEMWFIMDAEPGARLYSGFNRQITPDEYEQRVNAGTIMEVLQSHPVHRGDVFFIPSGRVHAICGGIRLAEVQQSSDVTYRIFDYNRPGLDGRPRQLHTEMARDAIDYTFYPTYRTDYLEAINKPVAITESPFFTVKIHNITRAFHRKLYKYDSFIVYTCLNGGLKIKMRDKASAIEVVELKKGESCVIPASIADLDLMPATEQGMTELLEVYIDNKHFN